METNFLSEWQLFIIVVYVVVLVVPFWKIFGKAGFPAWLAVLMVVPFVNFVLLYYVAFARWPALGESERPS